ncbi:DUF3576 domain-containing protein [Candidatus Pelagibacter sp.]|nr:DUF3576 domain-containing protein [Candidatus Pelagibacter sp.]
MTFFEMCGIFTTKKFIFLLIFCDSSGFKSINKFMYNFSRIILMLVSLVLLSGCQAGFFKRSDVKDNPVNVEDRVRKNIEEGRGVRFGIGKKKGGVFDFASSNELWRASVETLDFVPLVNASYSGGIIITDWFNGGGNNNRDLKITIRFLSPEIRSDALKIIIHERVCSNNVCSTNLIDSKIANEIQLAILKKAALFEKKGIEKLVKERRKKDNRGGDKAIPVEQR